MKKTKKILKKTLYSLLIITISMTSIGFYPIQNVFANDISNNTKLVLQSTNAISIDETDQNKVNYKINNVVVGTLKIRHNDNYITPVVNNNSIEFSLEQYTDTTYNIAVETTTINNEYEIPNNYTLDGTPVGFSNNGPSYIDITANKIFMMDFAFKKKGTSDPIQPPLQPPTNQIYPIVAYFEGISEGVLMDSEGSIKLPENWSTGKARFKAKVCNVGENIVPDDGQNICDQDTKKMIDVRVEGIANGPVLNDSVIGSTDRSYVKIMDKFKNYGKAVIHITSIEENGPVNTIVSIESDTLINIKAESNIAMSYSVGSAYVNQAVITDDMPKDLSIFFGNNQTKLIVSGKNVQGITKVVGGQSTIINSDNTATVTLPDLSKETTTKLIVAIKMKDGTTINRTINLKRTAIILEYDNHQNKLKAGYVMNKSYLYNNQQHNDEIFNAYLQVILYNDNDVVKYKQIKIDDEAIINRLHDNEAWSIETFDQNSIVLFNQSENKNVNKASVYLSNGPIDYNDSTLPSIEYGIGSGLMIGWGE